MSNLALVKSEMFGDVQCDFWQNDQGEILMTSLQIGTALEYADPQKGIDNLIARNNYLKNEEFSVTLDMRGTDDKTYQTRVFTEDGIYEVTMLSKTAKAKLFRKWVRTILKGLRKGQIKLVQPTSEQLRVAETKRQELEIKAKNADARLKNAQIREANFILKAVDKYQNVLSAQAVELLIANAMEVIVGNNALPRPQIEERYYTAGDIGKELGVSSTAVGKMANKHELKCDVYGMWVLDKSPHSNKQVESFRYNEKGKQKLTELIRTKKLQSVK